MAADAFSGCCCCVSAFWRHRALSVHPRLPSGPGLDAWRHSSICSLLTMVAFGFAVFGDVPDMWTLIGAGVIVASGIYLVHRERSLREEVAPTDAIVAR